MADTEACGSTLVYLKVYGKNIYLITLSHRRGNKFTW